MKKNIFLIIILILMIFPMNALADPNPDQGSNGDATSSSASKGAKSGLHIHDTQTDYGIRITVVDEYGKRISGTRTYDYWPNSFISSNIYQLYGSSYKTDIVNKYGLTSITFTSYKYPYSVEESAIFGNWTTDNWSTIHEKLYTEITNSLADYDTKGICRDLKFLKDDLQFDLCNYLKTRNKCEDLKKIYILIEPLVRLYSNGNTQSYILSGTEFANYVPNAYNKGIISYDVYSNNLGDSVFKNLMNFFLANEPNDDLTYSLGTNGKTKKVYTYFPNGAPAQTWLPSQTESELSLYAGQTRNTNGNPRGSSMQLIWFGKLKDKCREDCCVPCDPNDTECIKEKKEKDEDPYCCYEEEEIYDKDKKQCIKADDYWEKQDGDSSKENLCPNVCCIPCAVGDQACIDVKKANGDNDPYCCETTVQQIQNEENVCVDSKEYWDERQELFEEVCPNPNDECVPPPGDPTACCDDPKWQQDPKNYEAYVTYCVDKSKCNFTVSDPSINAPACENDAVDNITATFKDSLFANSSADIKNGTNAASADDIARTWDGLDNRFMSLFYQDYTVGGYPTNVYEQEESSTYCRTFCQENLIITLPDNQPYVKAGQYFYWDTGDEKHHILEVSGTRICAHDINLDDWLTDYGTAAEACDNSGDWLIENCENMKTGTVNESGIVTCINEKKAIYDSCMANSGGTPSNQDEIDEYENGRKEFLDSSDTAIDDMEKAANTEFSNSLKKSVEDNIFGNVSQEFIDNASKTLEKYNNSTNKKEKDDLAFQLANRYYINESDAKDMIDSANSAKDDAYQKKGDELYSAATGSSRPSPEPPCKHEAEVYGNAKSSGTTFGACIGYTITAEEQTGAYLGDPITPTLENLGNYLKECYHEDENGKYESDYSSNLQIDEYGYATSDDKNIYQSPDDIENDPKVNVSKVSYACVNLQPLNGVISDSCNYDNVFITREENDICSTRLAMPYFSKAKPTGKKDKDDNPIYDYEGMYGLHYGSYVSKPQCSSNNGVFGCDWRGSTIENIQKYWNTIFVTEETLSDSYVLNKTINACVCKDGEITDLQEDGTCNCELMTETNVLEDISTPYYCYYSWESKTSYVDLSDNGAGNFSVEFMTQTGWYPLFLTYSNIGFDGGNGGHFSLMLEDMADDSIENCNSSGACVYSDEDNACIFYVSNDILLDSDHIEDSICGPDDCPDPPGGPKCPDCHDPENPGNPGDDIPSDVCKNGVCVSGLELIYRIIDLDNPFPSGRAPGQNWQSITLGQNYDSQTSTLFEKDLVNDYITNNRGIKGNELYTSDEIEPLYSFVLNPAAIKAIRAFNTNNPDYASLQTMVFQDKSITGGVSAALRGDLKDAIISNGGTFTINLNNDNLNGTNRFTEILGNSVLDTSGNLNTCREAFE